MQHEYKNELCDLTRKFCVVVIVFLVLMALICLCSCSTKKQMAATVTTTDSVRIEIHTEKITVLDTVYLTLPQQSAQNTTTDTTSTLETDYSVSIAQINPDGTLYHDLRTKPDKIPVPTQRTEERRDSVIYKDKKVEVPVLVEKELTKWQEHRLQAYPYLLAACGILMIIVFRKPLIRLVKMFV